MNKEITRQRAASQSTATKAARAFQAELKTAQNSVKLLGSQRGRLIGDLRVEEAKVTQTVATLTELGIANADKMSVAELKAARDETQVDLVVNLDKLKAHVLEAEVWPDS